MRGVLPFGAMDAVVAALIVTIPVCAIAACYTWWIYRSRNSATFNRRSNSLAYVLLAVFAFAAVVSIGKSVSQSKLFCSLFGFSSIVFVNESGRELEDVRIALRSSDGVQRYTYTWNVFSRRQRERFDVHTPQLLVESVTGRAGTNQFSYTGTVAAGQLVTLRVDLGGNLSATSR
jgi:hypothetical protein